MISSPKSAPNKREGHRVKFTASLDAAIIRCQITADRALAAPVLCYSCMAPSLSADGLTRLASIGGYTEIQLPDLQLDQPYAFSLMYENPAFLPANRAWLPMGAYLRCGDEVITLPKLRPAGVQRGAMTYGAGTAPSLLLCPQPTSFAPSGGSAPIISVRSRSSALQEVDALFQRNGLGQLLAEDGLPIVLEHNAALASEAYILEITPAKITLSHSTESGVFYGGITLASLIFLHDGAVPCGTITDRPRFSWRGQHLDCARHFYEVETILRLLDLMALLKLNRFHWHFADDEAFRLELASLPDLSKTHFRGEGALVPALFGGGPHAGGSYSRADVSRILAHAKALSIEVIPEIEIPAHAFALCAVYPDTRDPEETGTEQSVQGYFRNVANPAMPETWRIWESMADEISTLFPFDVIHLGGDELPEDTWSGSPAARALMAKEGLHTTQDLQGWIMHKMASRTSALGKTPAGWEESALGTPNIGADAIIFSWTGQGPGLEAARRGNQVVMMPGQKTYLDMAQTASPDDWGATWATIIGLEDTIDWDPVPDDEPELEAQIIGVEGAFWSEFTTQDNEMEAMLAPRILGIATKAWARKDQADRDTLLGLRATYARLFDQIGWDQA